MAKEQSESGERVPSLDPVLRIVGDYAEIARRLEADINQLRLLLEQMGENDGKYLYIGFAWFRYPRNDDWEFAIQSYSYPGVQINPVFDGRLDFPPETGQDNLHFSAQSLYQINISEPWAVGGLSERDTRQPCTIC
ncbi:MAG: hypothetical protein L0154_17655 [Chloroflexi bacterium]|nr:hypothetical protein [Chloroflexota bacterium]